MRCVKCTKTFGCWPYCEKPLPTFTSDNTGPYPWADTPQLQPGRPYDGGVERDGQIIIPK